MPAAVTQTSVQLVLGMATVGRPETAARTLKRLERQTHLPDRVIVCVPDLAELAPVAVDTLPVPEVHIGPRGLTHQRNVILDLVPDEAILVFIDDDQLLADDYLAQTMALFDYHPNIAVATGDLLADGIHGPGLTFDDAEALLLSNPQTPRAETLSDTYSGYGCNMAFRMQAVRKVGARFHEGLPAYGWLEDLDFCRRLLPEGRIVRSNLLRGVHMGQKSGRQSGVRLGYSQVANPLHLMGRKTMDPGAALHHISRNIAANLAKSFWSEPWIDRRGRLKGNALAILDLLRGRIDPERIRHLG